MWWNEFTIHTIQELIAQVKATHAVALSGAHPSKPIAFGDGRRK
jgi:hypothetical protein